MISRYLRFPGGKYKALTLSYDDGVYQDLRMIEILKKHGIKCTFNLNAGLLGTGSRLSKEQILENYTEDMFEIACHGYTHPWLDFTRLESTADGHLVYNPNVRTVWFADRRNNIYEVNPGETIQLG